MRAAWGALLGLALAAAAEGAVAGRVTDGAGRPLPGATVTAYGPESSDERLLRRVRGRARTPVASTRSGADGAFRFAALAGPAVFEARAAGFAPVLEPAPLEGGLLLPLKPAALRRGRVTAAGRPVAGAHVVVSGRAEWLADTAADGTYEVPDLAGWAGEVQVFHPDYAPASRDGDTLAAGLDIALEPGVAVEGRVVDEHQRPVAAATVWLGQPASLPLAVTAADGSFRVAHAEPGWSVLSVRTDTLAGKATRAAHPLVVVHPARSFAGTVRDARTGQPIGGAAVWLFKDGYRAVMTDGQGRYVLGGLEGGTHRVAVTVEGYASGPEAGASIDLSGAPTARHDFALLRQPMARGRVEDEAHRPVDGALVLLGLQGVPLVYAANAMEDYEMVTASTRSGPDGAFALTLPVAGTEAQMAEQAQSRPLIILKTGYAAARAEVKGPITQPPPLVVVLARGIELAGRVVSGDGTPLPGVDVALSEDGPYGTSELPMSVMIGRLRHGWVTSGPDGRFSTRVHPALHHLAFHRAGFAPKVVRAHDPRTGGALEVVMEAAASISGRLVRADGRPVAQASIALASSEGAPFEGAKGHSGDDGSFAIGDLAPGPYVLRAWNDDLFMGKELPVEAPSRGLVVRFDPTGTLRGRVIDAATHKPVTAFTIAVAREGPGGREGGPERAVPVSDPAGMFSVGDLAAGSSGVGVTAEGYATRTITGVEIAADAAPAELEVALDPEAVVRGRVTDESQAGVADVTVVVDGRDTSEGPITSDQQGRYEINGLAAGELSLTFEVTGFLPEQRTFDSRQGGRLDVTLRRGLSVSGDVKTEAGGAVEGVTVTARTSAARASYQSATTDGQGRFRLQGLVPGRYTLEASGGQGLARVEDVDPQAAGAVHLVMVMPKTAVLTGRLSGLARTADSMVPMVEVQSEDDARNARGLVDGSARFRIADAPAGMVTVYAHVANGRGGMRSSRPVELVLAAGSETDTVLEFPSEGVSGVVTREGAPVAGATVSFSGVGPGSGLGHTDASGAYEVDGLDPGAYRVMVRGEGWSYETQYVLSGRAELDIDVTGAGLQGRVVRAGGDEPVRGVEIALWALAGRQNTPTQTMTSNERGEFALRSVVEGRYRLTTSKAGFGQEVRELELEKGATQQVSIELAPAGGIDVTVVDARDGQALEAVVVVRDAARHIVANGHSGVGADGALNIPLADGAYLLSTSASGFGTVTRPVTAPTSGLRIGLTPGGTLVIESARALQGRVRLLQPDGEEYVRCWCNGIADIELKGRRTTVENVTAGSYTLEVLVGGEVVAQKPVVVSEGQKTTVAID